MPDHYDVLGVRRDATPNEIKTAFRRLARLNHPDVNPGQDAEQKFLQILEAYEALGDPERRREFDLSIPGAGHATGTFTIDDFTRQYDLDDLFAGEALERIFGRRGRAGTRPEGLPGGDGKLPPAGRAGGQAAEHLDGEA
jgi:molecular chaperone DnaJ